jgi:hypothetical protein
MIDRNDFKNKSKKVKKEEIKERNNSLQKQQFKAIESFRKRHNTTKTKVKK